MTISSLPDELAIPPRATTDGSSEEDEGEVAERESAELADGDPPDSELDLSLESARIEATNQPPQDRPKAKKGEVTRKRKSRERGDTCFAETEEWEMVEEEKV